MNISIKLLIFILLVPIFILFEIRNIDNITFSTQVKLENGQLAFPVSLMALTFLFFIYFKKIIAYQKGLVVLILLSLIIDYIFSELHFRELFLRLSLIYFIYSYKIFINILENINISHINNIKGLIGKYSIIIISIWWFTAFFCGPGFFLSCQIYSYNFQQYSAAIISCLLLYSVCWTNCKYKIFFNSVLYFACSIWLFYVSDSRLVIINVLAYFFILITYAIKETKVIYQYSYIFIIMAVFANVFIFLYAIFMDQNIAFDLRIWRSALWLNLLENISYSEIFFPYLNENIGEMYSYHNEYMEVFRVLGLPISIIWYYWIFKIISPSQSSFSYFWILLWLIYGYGLVVNPLTHLYSGAIISFLIAINNRIKK
jgi:hypothetical protein